MRIATLVTSLTLALALTSGATAQRQSLQVGSKAPGLDIEAWVKGEETTIQPGRAYVVEFWATWCAPCRRSIPHLTELQQKYGPRGLTIIGISDEDVDTVKPFVTQWGARMDYTVAVDRRGQTKRSWFQAAGLQGIPAAFVVDQRGIIQWIGNPLANDFDEVVERVVRGRYDARLFARTKEIRAAIDQQRQLRNYRHAKQLIDELINVERRVFAPWALTKFEIILVDERDREGAYAYALEMLEEFAGDIELLQDLATKIAADPKLNRADRDLDMALVFAKVAAEGLPEDSPERYATVALVHFHRGELDEAISEQRKAFFVARPDSKPRFESVLREYQQAARRAARLES